MENNILTVKIFIDRFEQFAPPTYAVEKDPIGLHFGQMNQKITKILVTLDVRPEVVDEAIEIGADFIFTHHPPIFSPVGRLTEDDPQQAMYAKIIRNNIAVYAAHTNLDAAPAGMNDWLADLYQIKDTEVLLPHTSVNYYRVTVYIPNTGMAKLTDSLAAHAYGALGNYENVGYQSEGIGTFKPTEAANPTIGTTHQQEFVDETAYSLLVSDFDLNDIIALIKDIHPYEVPVIDVVRLENMQEKIGIGRIGNLAKAVPFNEYAEFVKQQTGVAALRTVVADKDRLVKRVAVLGGDGGKHFDVAIAKGADTFITGDVYYHVAHDMIAGSLNVIDPGHHFESICKDKLNALFNQWSTDNSWPVEIISSQLNTDPYIFI